jgi:ribonuclease PH
MRLNNRSFNELRPTEIIPNPIKWAEGSALIKMGDTHVIATATVEDKVPPFIKGSGSGWVTAEYGMLPRSTESRMDREASKGKQTGRTQEIQRLIGRALRMVVDLKALGEKQIRIDCDVIQADGGTRVASINAGYVAMKLALEKMKDVGKIKAVPLIDSIAAVSCGIIDGEALLDLDYSEDSKAGVDANFVLLGSLKLIEVQATSEHKAFTEDQLSSMILLAKTGIKELTAIQSNIFLAKS